jgi:hypothetical protein
MRKQPLLPVVGALNAAFSIGNINRLVEQRKNFASGKSLARALIIVLGEFPEPIREVFEEYINRIPGAIQETLRSVIYYALSTDPPTLISFSWAPSYDYEVNVWHIVEPEPQRSGITVFLKSRYPDDPHPQVV